MIFRKNQKRLSLDKSKLPNHIAIIMDGNGRWAQKRGLPRSLGHREGGKVLKNIARYCDDLGVKHLTLYAFSTENWKRPKKEVDYLMELLIDYLKNIESHLEGRKIRVRVVGAKEELSQNIQDEIHKVEKKTSTYEGLSLNLAINYGGRKELIFAFKKLAKSFQEGRISLDNIDEENISNNLYTSFMPDPELLIRTGGEQRVSNYMLWQCAYSELYFSDVLWPDFKEKHLEEIIFDFQKRNRRFGGI